MKASECYPSKFLRVGDLGGKALPVEPSPTPPAKLPLEPAGDEEAMPF